ncbi:MAG: hypothetical protein IKR25_02720, partial [Muribaculaceae bacterium]|nr:hypothetical protein [Muribaculaceae bacterium]
MPGEPEPEPATTPEQKVEPRPTEPEPVPAPKPQDNPSAGLDAPRQEETPAPKPEPQPEQKPNPATPEPKPEQPAPDMARDNPADARQRGFRVTNGHIVDRQDKLSGVQGTPTTTMFGSKQGDTVPTTPTVIEAVALQPSHIAGQRNPRHFLDEAQPKERNDQASAAAVEQMAAHMRPEQITDSATAYTGALVTNARGEVIQGNNRAAALRTMWGEHPEQAEAYKQFLIDNAERLGLDPEAIRRMRQPVLVNVADVDDARAIQLGNLTAADTESGGHERIRPENTVPRMGNDMETFARMLLDSAAEDDMTISELIRKNGLDTLKWLNRKGYITTTQYQSAFDSRGNLTDDARQDLNAMLAQAIFKDGGTLLPEQFRRLPVKAQRALLATMWRDTTTPSSHKVTPTVQQAIAAFDEIGQHSEDFDKAKNVKQALQAAALWAKATEMDWATGNSQRHGDIFPSEAIQLAALFKGLTQREQQTLINDIIDRVQGNPTKG